MVFAKLRRLAPTKLDQQDSGNMLKMIGEDIEAMEVFFAHTLPPVMTASLVTIILAVYYWSVSPVIAVISLLVYAILAISYHEHKHDSYNHYCRSSHKHAKLYVSFFG